MPLHLQYLPLFVIGLLLLGSTTQAQTTFSNVAPSAGIDHVYHTMWEMGGGAAIFDYNKDSLLDIYYLGGTARDALYQNNGDGTFTNVAMAAGLGFTDSVITLGITTGDIDNDGYREVFLSTMLGEPNRILKNNGNGTFTDISVSAGITNDSLFTLGSSFGDYNKDGYLDIYVSNYVQRPRTLFDSLGNFASFAHTCSPNTLFLNNGDETFTDVTNTTQTADTGCALATAFTDYNSDGNLDIWVINDFGAWISPNTVYHNTGTAFNNVGNAANIDIGIYGMGIAIGDYDQDLDLDYYITNIGRNVLHKNNGNGTFTDTTNAAGVSDQWLIQDSLHATGWGTGFMDIDNDSYVDLFVANGYMPAVPELKTSLLDPDKLYRNNGDGTFSDISNTIAPDSNHISRGFAFGDVDNDGDIDLVPIPGLLTVSVDTHKVPLYQNNLNNTNNWLQVSLEGVISNRDAYGAQIKIYINGQSWIHEIDGGSSHASQHSTIAHFGLGSATIVDSLVIHWPNGLIETVSNIAPNQRLYLTEGTITNTSNNIHQTLGQLIAAPNPANQQLLLRYNLHQQQTAQLSIWNALGQEIWQLKDATNQFINQNIAINTSNFANGIYFIHLTANGKTQTQKIVIQH